MNELVPQSESALAPRPAGNGLAALLADGRAETAKALAQAIGACAAVPKEDYNSYHKYKYASADAIIEAGRKALADAGLALLPIEASLNGTERSGDDRFELVRTFALLHSSGEVTPLRVVWPVCVEKGRPLDKATAIADTLSLSYLMRDLLLMNRVDPSDDVNARVDRTTQKQPAEAEVRARRGAALEKRTRERDGELAGEGRCKPGELVAYVLAAVERATGQMPAPWAEWTPTMRQRAIDGVKEFEAAHPAKQPPANGSAAPPATITAQQVAELRGLLQQMQGGPEKQWPRVRDGFQLGRLATIENLPAALYHEVLRCCREQHEADERFKTPARK